jgi:outer membrane protein W
MIFLAEAKEQCTVHRKPDAIATRTKMLREWSYEANVELAVAIGLDYRINEVAMVYVAFARTDNDEFAAYSANNHGHGDDVGAFAPGFDPSAFSVGFSYSFHAGL